MTPQLLQPGDTIDVELDQLTYSAYLLTLDPDLALSVVMAAVDTSMEDLASRCDLIRRTIEISLAQLRLDVSAASDRESWAFETLLYSDSSLATSRLALALKEQTNGNPILLLDSGARIAFVLHHVLHYSVNGAAAMAQISEKEYRIQLRKAYLQLASLQLGVMRLPPTCSARSRRRRGSMSVLRWIWAYLFDCVHSHTTWPHQDQFGHAYVCCTDCGREMPYSVEYMHIVRQDRKRNILDSRFPATASLIIAGALLLLTPSYALAKTARPSADQNQSARVYDNITPTFMIGFVGGFVHRTTSVTRKFSLPGV